MTAWLAVEPARIPSPLIERPQWMIWRPEWNGSRWNKAPRDPRTGRIADKRDPRHWASIEEALAGMTRHDAQGVGYCLRAGEDLVIVDVDGRTEADPWAAAIVHRLASYTERSPSGSGLRIVLEGSKPAGAGCRWRLAGGELEVYDAGAFLTITGCHVAGTPPHVEDRTAELVTLAPPVAAVRPDQVQRAAVAGDDAELLRRAHSARNGARFARLWRGDLADVGGDASRGDWRLVLYLTYWTGGDPARIDRLFRLSGLYRPKWDERHSASGLSYGELTIAKAVSRA